LDANRGGGNHGLAIPGKRSQKPRLGQSQFSSSFPLLPYPFAQ